jgi:hypothetical protein
MRLIDLKEDREPIVARALALHLMQEPGLTDGDLFAIGITLTAHSQVVDEAIKIVREEQYAAENPPSTGES